MPGAGVGLVAGISSGGDARGVVEVLLEVEWLEGELPEEEMLKEETLKGELSEEEMLKEETSEVEWPEEKRREAES